MVSQHVHWHHGRESYRDLLLIDRAASYSVTVQREARVTGMWLVQCQPAPGISCEGHGANARDEYETVGVGKQCAVSCYAWRMNDNHICHLHREAEAG